MRFNRFPSLVLMLAALVAAGCGQNNISNPAAQNSGASTDEAMVVSTLAGQPQVVEDGLAESADPSQLSEPAGPAAAIQPLRYWRRIVEQQRRFEIAFSDTDATGRPTTAVVTIHKRLYGTFNILVGEPDPSQVPPDSGLVIHKRLEDHWTRRVLLKRVRLAAESGEPIWRIVATSGVEVTSRDAITKIVSLRVQAAAMDTTLTDPLAFQRLRRILRFAPDSRVTLTATTLRNDDVVVLQLADQRFRFRNNGNNTYTGEWLIGMFAPGVHHFGVNALSHGTLFDDVAPYDSQAWMFPYVIEPEPLADSMP